ncbi:transcriptional coactivator p15/PC4 family protein [Ralstonia solanacearum P673]|uniref:transcriptional coactivator p15/PC4 family protein n=1 Tax=Ralstonia solanacearum TaxID=305 RepID=UPI00044DC055|nr:transcriptional coactivator p15/PC4 family protein [Ralstonia solanacearum]EUJ15161.1 hypothetical protein RSP673_07010 [Ralstonia solanacearum P673]MCL9851189.1 transcriptional coactivator p15/PC4 family protein [Ralstonia solanacearum]MCL9855766.1 transcriptional coactivator p15/PC4 family protein [Ralstonia solanacearum]MCL9860282.1 transcriptional coactivator p15/PC4 family protein [Ralstonia solanacearum]MCL9865513.1 transcriptional coactivator p15/PC4 family protein [Ralstonia solanac
MTTAATIPTRFLDLQKNARERLRIHVKEYKGLTYVDLRVWFVAEDGEYVPSSKGVMLKPGHVVEVAQGLLLASQAADVKGMS